MGKWLLNLLSFFIPITGNNLLDSIILLIIGGISLSVAFAVVGKMHCGDSYSSSIIHWIIRIAIFLGLTVVLYSLVRGIVWINNQQLDTRTIIVCCVLLSISFVLSITRLILRSKR